MHGTHNVKPLPLSANPATKLPTPPLQGEFWAIPMPKIHDKRLKVKRMSAFAKLFKFGRDVRAEAGRITWPKRQDTQRMTLMVFVLVFVIAVFLVSVDLLIGFGLSHLFGLNA